MPVAQIRHDLDIRSPDLSATESRYSPRSTVSATIIDYGLIESLRETDHKELRLGGLLLLFIHSWLKANLIASPDDGLIVVAMILAIGLAVTAIFAMRTMYIGIHYWNVPLDSNYKRAFIWTYAMGVIYMPILSIVKISVLLFILRFSGVKSGVRYIVWGNGIFNLLLMISVFFVMLFDCVPFAKNWDSTLDGYCVDVGKFSLASSIFAIVTDVVAIALPFYIFWSLNMSMRKKLGLMLIFSVSLLSVAFSCIRLYYIMGLYNTTNPDPDSNYSITFTFSAIEVNLAIIAASIPALWPLVRGRVGKSTTAASSTFNASRRYTKHQQGWIRTTDQNESSGTRNDQDDIHLNDMSDRTVQTQITRGSLPNDSDEEILPDRGHRKEDGSILKTTQISYSVSSG